jgi:hypothetical protein
MASGKQLVDAITKLLSAGKTAEARAAVEADRLANIPVRPTEKLPENLLESERVADKRQAAADLRQKSFPTARVQEAARRVEFEERKAMPERSGRTDANELLESLLNIRTGRGEQLDLPLQPPERGLTKKLTPLQEARRRDAKLAELEEASDETGEAIKGKATEDINTAFDRLMRERNVSADELQPLPESIKKPLEKQKTKWDEKKKAWRTPTKEELEKGTKAVTEKGKEVTTLPLSATRARLAHVPGKKIEEGYVELDRPQVFRDPEQQEQVIRQSGGAKGVFEDPIDEIGLDDAMRREEYLDRVAGYPTESPTKFTPVPKGDKINYDPKTGRIRETPRAAPKPTISMEDFIKLGLAPRGMTIGQALKSLSKEGSESPLQAVAPAVMPGTFRAAGTGGRGRLPTRATTKTGDLEEQGIGASRAGSDPIQQKHISAEELTMDSPQAQEQMLDLFGEKQDELLNRMRELIKQLPEEESGFRTTKKRLPGGAGVITDLGPKKIWDPNRVKRLINLVARSKSVDELAGQLHGMRGKGTKPRDLLDETGFTPVSIDNLRATLLQAPESPQRTASLEKLNKWSKEITDRSKGRFTKRLPEAFKTKKQLGDPKPELLEEWNRFIAPVDPADKVAAHAEDLRQLYRTARGDFPPKDPSKVIRRNTDKSKRLKAIQAAGEKAKFVPPHTPLGPPLDQSMIDMLRELLGQ